MTCFFFKSMTFLFNFVNINGKEMFRKELVKFSLKMSKFLNV